VDFSDADGRKPRRNERYAHAASSVRCDGVMSRFTDHLGRDRRMIAPDEPGEQRDGKPISDVPMKKSAKPVRSMTKAEAPAASFPAVRRAKSLAHIGWRRAPSTRARTCR
jgi:hypothetical protein